MIVMFVFSGKRYSCCGKSVALHKLNEHLYRNQIVLFKTILIVLLRYFLKSRFPDYFRRQTIIYYSEFRLQYEITISIEVNVDQSSLFEITGKMKQIFS